MTRLSELGESHVLDRILSGNGGGAQVIVGPGDDAAVTRVTGDLVSTADMLVEGEDFTRDWLDWHRLGRKAAAQNLADVCVMGAKPHGLLVSLAVPNSTDIADLEALYSGIRTEAELAGAALDTQIPIIGGDLSSAGLIVIAITALGTLEPGRAAITRAGARAGDAIHLAGTIGLAAAGLDLLFAGHRLESAAPELAELIETQLAPRPDYAALREATASGGDTRRDGTASADGQRPFTAMIDISDGLSTDLGRIASASGVAADIDRAALDELIDPLLPAARILQPSAPTELALTWVLGGGEDHGFAASSAERSEPGVGWRRIGEMRAGDGVSLDGTPVPTSGFSHFGK